MRLIDLIHSYEIFTLLCIEGEPADFQDDLKSKLKYKIFRRALDLGGLGIDKKHLSRDEQERLTSENPKIRDLIQQATFEIKIEMLNHLIIRLREKMSKDTKLGTEDKIYYTYLIERVDGLLKKSMGDKISEDEQLDLKLFCNKFNEYNIL